MEKSDSPRKTRRRERLSEIIQDVGSASNLAKEINTPKSHISAILAGRRGLGDALAGKIERRYSKPSGWFDTVTHKFHVTASTPENQPNVAVTHVQQAQTAINNAALSADALRLAGFLDRIPDTDQRFRAYCECMALITTRLDRTEQNALHGSLAQRETSIEESPYRAAARKTQQTLDIGHHAR
jgi:plasmid maintenance system antidote protein VapI